MNPNIFRAYDIRGIADADLTDDVVDRIGRAYGTRAAEGGASRVCVGRDVRLSSPRKCAACAWINARSANHCLVHALLHTHTRPAR